jgi:alpha-beta hydrolase superfamily lysophospholipase
VTPATGFLEGVGGRRIFWQAWTPEAPVAVVVIVHGAGEHSGRYDHVVARLVAAGYAVHAADHRGHGRSDGARALVERIDYAVADLDQVVAAAGHAHPGLPVFMLGHSMGGLIALRYALAHQERLAGMILSSPLAALEAVPTPLRIIGQFLSRVAPRAPLIAIDSSLVSRDAEVVRAYRADPLVFHGKLPARTAAELADAVDAFPATVAAIRLPTLILYGSADGLCPPAGSLLLGERIGAPDKTVRAYEGLFHEILNEPERDEVLDDICAWLSDRVPASDRDAAGFSRS